MAYIKQLAPITNKARVKSNTDTQTNPNKQEGWYSDCLTEQSDTCNETNKPKKPSPTSNNITANRQQGNVQNEQAASDSRD